MHWFVARTKTNSENRAAENVARQGCEFYFPKIMEMALIRGKRCPRVRPLFPGYLFIKTVAGQWHFLTNTIGIYRVITFGGEPAVIDNVIIDDIRSRESNGCVVLPAAQQARRFVQGQSVRVREGLFSGLTGIYDGSNSRDCERVLLEYLGRKSRVLIAPENLEAA